ncbi:MAG: ComEC/Rec2 family competence protein, partial [Planctomycetaceae bacterium]|nr:ComEC/Rec2 family competence protein [Planctomycetaceae bacterium]
ISGSVALVESWRLATRDALENALSGFGDARSRELVMAIVLGVRQDDFYSLSLPYRRTGLAHYLAVSGFAFGVLVAMPRFITSGRNDFFKTASVILVVVFGLCAVDVRSPALRAGLIAATTALGIGLKREWNRSSLLGLTCMTLLAIQPSELLNPGFQLSFIVVASLLVLTPILRNKFTHEHRGGVLRMIRSWFTQACICGIIAWVCATPLVIHHFGVVSTSGVIMSVLAAPLVAVIVVTAVVAIILSLISTTLSLPVGALSAGSAWVLDRSASIVSDVPGTCFVMPMTSVAWMICTEIVAWRWFLHRGRWERT